MLVTRSFSDISYFLSFSMKLLFQVVWRKLSDEPEQRQNGTHVAGDHENEILEDLL